MKIQDSHERILNEIMSRYNRPVMNNVDRGLYVEHLIADALGPDWLPSGSDWAAWDCQHRHGDRIEIKQSAARQSWDVAPVFPPDLPRFDIAPAMSTEICKGIWVKCEIDPPNVWSISTFSLHGEKPRMPITATPPMGFLVVQTDLCNNQKSIRA